MADIEKISVGGTSYDVRDANAAHALADIAVAGSNVTFTQAFSYSIQKQGDPTLADGTATGLSPANYLYVTDLPDDDVTYYFKIKTPPTLYWADVVKYGDDSSNLFMCAIWQDTESSYALRTWNEGAGTADAIIPSISGNTTYWLKIEVSGDKKTYSYSTDGASYIQSLVVNDPRTVQKYLKLGGGTHSGFENGTMYLTECYAVSGGTEVWRGATIVPGKIGINANTAPSLMVLRGTTAPTTATAGSVGQFYVDTKNKVGYMCVSAADSTYVWKRITA